MIHFQHISYGDFSQQKNEINQGLIDWFYLNLGTDRLFRALQSVVSIESAQAITSNFDLIKQRFNHHNNFILEMHKDLRNLKSDNQELVNRVEILEQALKGQ